MEKFLGYVLDLLSGFGNTVLLFLVTLVLAIPLGLLVSFLSMSKVKWIKAITRFFISIIRGTPLMLQLIIIFYGPGLVFGPGYGFKEIKLFGYILPGSERMIAAIVAFVINYSAYFSEIFRGGIESISKGQYEAGMVLGLKKGQIFRHVILLQVVKNIVPPMGNEIITLVKDTSLARIISVTELTFIADSIRYTTGNGILPLVAAGVFYYLFNALVAFLLKKLEKKLEYIKV